VEVDMNERLAGLAMGVAMMACESSAPADAPTDGLPPFEGTRETPPIDLVVPASVEVAVFGLG
jgi:hypothetical protein